MAAAQPRQPAGSSHALTAAILLGLVLGGVLGQLVHSWGWDQRFPAILTFLDFLGQTVFMGLLKMILVPLVVASVVTGVGSIGDPARLRYVGSMTLLYYFSTMLIAVVLGLFLVTTIRPGERTDPQYIAKKMRDTTAEEGGAQATIQQASETGLWGAVENIVKQLIPANPLQAAAEGKLLSVIAFSLILGIALATVGSAGEPLRVVFESLLVVTMRLVEWILWLAPLGVFALTAWTVARIGLQELFRPLVYFVVTVLLGLFLHGLVILPAVLWLFGRTHPYRFLWQMRAALLTAFGTDSSSATLPVTIECAEGPGECSRRAARFVLPLGATINMDGTALYEAVAVVFLMQCMGIPLAAEQLGIVALTATLAAVGAAGIPSAGLVTMVIVVEAVNSSLGGDKHLELSAIGIILGIDRLLDMCRTMVNVWGDAVGARLITRIAPD